MEIILALDIGKKRCGIAKADILGILVSPLATIELKALEAKLLELKKEFLIKKVIVGIPENYNNLENQGTKNFIINFIKKLDQSVLADCQIIFEDESCSSKEAEEMIRSKGISINKENKSLIDAYAACVILEQYLKTNQRH